MPTRVKICGIKTADIMRVALDAGADDVGLVFFAKSPRNISLDEASALAGIARGRARVVALTVDADSALLDAIVTQVKPDLLQLQGAETPAHCREVKFRWKTPVMKAIGVASAADAQRALAYVQPAADLILFDAKAPKNASLPGGNGLAFDWTMLEDIANRVPYMLAGGLTPENVATAIDVTGCNAVDVSSGVESAPGVKDAALIRAFIRAAKGSVGG
jgi:phosphoribosylanthranilate isomerase